MSVILYNLTTGALMVLLIRAGNLLVTGVRRVPWLAIAGILALAGGLVLQATWSGAMATLDDDPARSGWWRPLSAVFLQSGGFAGAAFNLVTAAIVLALAEWHWGRVRTLALLLCAVLLPQSLDVLSGAGRSTDPRNFVGSSGAVYFLGATLAGALLLAGPSARLRLLGAAVPVTGLLLWFVQANGHGLVSAEGFAVGVLVAAVSAWMPEAPARDGQVRAGQVRAGQVRDGGSRDGGSRDGGSRDGGSRDSEPGDGGLCAADAAR